ncbi:GntR family transcriptional regulator, partial [Acinetobacter baumannii]
EMFLSEAQVAAASGTSRTPVREALLRLEAEGFIRRVPHKGAYIPALTDKDVDDVMQARRVVEEWSIAQVAPNPGQVPDRL